MLKILVAGGFHTNKHFPIHLRLNLSTALPSLAVELTECLLDA